MPWCKPLVVIRSRSVRGTSRIAMPESAARVTDSVSRSSAWVPSATYSAVAGTPARRHSTTGLRPNTVSKPSSLRLAGRRACALSRLAAGWYGRMCAGGVAPRPSSPRRRWPPEPTVGPFLVPALRTAPRRRELPAIGWRSQRPRRAVAGVGDLDSGILEPIPDLVGQLPVALHAGLFAPFQLGAHQHVDRGQRSRRLVVRLPTLVERVAAENAHHRADRGGAGQRLVVVTGIKSAVAFRAGVVHLGQRDRHRQVVVECG